MSSSMGIQGVGSSVMQRQKSMHQGIVNLMQGSLKYGDGKSVANTSIIVTIIMIILIIGIILQYSKTKSSRNESYRLMTALFLGTGGTLLYGFTVMAAIAYKSKTTSNIQMIIHLFKILMFTYFYAAYCIFPLIVYVKSDENIYDDAIVSTHHNYAKTIDIINLITNILVICAMIYIIYLLLWQRDSVILKRQLLVISVIFGVKVGKSVKEIIDKMDRTRAK
jgi:hypothetical protein